jgi:hypothetical protein
MEQPTAEITMASFLAMFIQKKIPAFVLCLCQGPQSACSFMYRCWVTKHFMHELSTDTNKSKFKNWKRRSKNKADWEKSINDVEVRIGM